MDGAADGARLVEAARCWRQMVECRADGCPRLTVHTGRPAAAAAPPTRPGPARPGPVEEAPSPAAFTNSLASLWSLMRCFVRPQQ